MARSKQVTEDVRQEVKVKKARDSKDYEVMLLEMLEEEFNKKENS